MCSVCLRKNISAGLKCRIYLGVSQRGSIENESYYAPLPLKTLSKISSCDNFSRLRVHLLPSIASASARFFISESLISSMGWKKFAELGDMGFCSVPRSRMDNVLVAVTMEVIKGD